MTSKPIRRPSRWEAVWLTYRTRWQLVLMLVVLASVYVPIVPIMWFGDPNVVKSADPAAPQPSPVGYVGSVEQARDLDWSTLRSLTVYNLKVCEPLWTPGRAPKLESLTILDGIMDEQLAKLCELYDLKTLTLYSPQLLTADGWSHIKGEVKLTYLRLVGMHALHNEPSLAWPPNLQTLICDNTHGKTQQRLDEWQQLPHLTSLSTMLIPRDGDHLAPEMLDTLRRFPSLRRLYLVEMGKHAPNYVVVQQAALPSVRVRPANYHPERGQRAAMILIGGLLVLVLLSVQLSSQFVTTASVLTPHFSRSHLSLVIGLFIVLAAVSLSLLLWVGCSILIAFSLCGASALLLAAGTKSASLMSGNQLPGFCNFAIVFPSIMFPAMSVVVGLMLFGANFDWFLSGHQPVLAVIVLVGSLCGAFYLIAMQTGLRRRLEESGTANVPMRMFDTRGWGEWTNSLAAVRTDQGKREALPLRLMDARIDRFVARHQARSGTTLVALWRLGGQSTTDVLRYTVIFLVVVLIFVGVPTALLAPELWSQFGSVLVAPMVFQLLGGGLIMPLAFAWARRPMLELELLRPVSRRDWASTWFRGVAAEIAPVLLVSIAFGAALQWTGQLGSWSMMQASLAAVFVVGITGIIFAVGMWTLTLRSLWQIVLIGCIAWIAVVLCIVTPILLQSHIHEWQTPAILIPTIVGLYAVAFIGLRLAWWRWQNWEVGCAA